jgi:hypothetical protein
MLHDLLPPSLINPGKRLLEGGCSDLNERRLEWADAGPCRPGKTGMAEVDRAGKRG